MMGIVYGMVKEQWTFWTSLYFAVTSMSTAGLQGIGDPEDPESTIFTGLYALVGVPLYGLALGQGASLLVQARVKRLARKQFNQVISLEEFQTAQEDLPTTDAGDNDVNAIELIEFLQMECLRTGKCDLQFLKDTVAHFKACDLDSSGTISRDEIVVLAAFDRYDLDGTGFLERDEFKLCVNELQSTGSSVLTKELSETELDAIYSASDTDSSGPEGLDREEFMKFLKDFGRESKV